MNHDVKKQDEERKEFLSKFRKLTPSGHATFDLDKYYDSLSFDEIVKLRDKTVADLERNPNFGTRFYSDFVVYLNKILEKKV
jgi:hypothetical protein